MFSFFSRKKGVEEKQGQSTGNAVSFSFGDAESVLSGSDLVSMFNVYWNGQYYEYPFSPNGIYKTLGSSSHHASAIDLKANLLCSIFKPSAMFSTLEFERFAKAYLVFGNAYLVAIYAQNGKVMKYESPSPLFMRKTKHSYGMILQGDYIDTYGLFKEFAIGQVAHLKNCDLSQDFYGKPYYLACLQSAWLNEDATLFRRRYFKNGNHAGFILYMSDEAYNEDDITSVKEAMKNSKGVGAFRNLFLYAPKGKKDGIQVIPVESAQAQDKFFDIKNVTKEDVMAMHRIPPNMMAVQSANAGGFGNLTEARAAMMLNEIYPIARRMASLHQALQFDIPMA